MERVAQTRGLRDFLTIPFKHKYKILVTFLATVAVVTAGSFLIAPTYEAKSTLLVKFGREHIHRPEAGESAFIPLSQEEVINSEVQILSSQDLIEKVIKTIKAENLYPALAAAPPGRVPLLAAAVHRFEKNLTVEGIKKSNVIQVSFQHRDPTMAARVVNLLVDSLREKHLNVYSDPRSSFLEQQLGAFELRLRESQDRLEEFKQKNRVYSLEEQRTLLLHQRTGLDTALKAAQNQANELTKKLSTLKSQAKTVSKDTPHFTETERYKIIDDAKSQLLGLRLKEQGLVRSYKETNELVVSARKEIEIVQKFIRQQEEELQAKVRTGPNVVYQDLEREMIKTEADLSSQEAKVDTLRGQIAQLDRDLQTLDRKENELENLKRELSSNEKNYKVYLEKVEEARISDDLNHQKMATLSVVQIASVPAKPIKPKKAFNVLVSVVLGAVAGLGFAVFAKYTDQSLSTPDNVERRLGLPVLASVMYKK